MPGLNPTKILGYRHKAAMCGTFAAWAHSTEERDRLLRMRDSWSSRADHEEFVDGLPPLPPARAAAIPRFRPDKGATASYAAQQS